MRPRLAWRRAHSAASLAVVLGVALTVLTTSAPGSAGTARTTGSTADAASATGAATSSPSELPAPTGAVDAPTSESPAGTAGSGEWTPMEGTTVGGSPGAAETPAAGSELSADPEGGASGGTGAQAGYSSASASGAGVPAGWTPTTTMTSDLRITTPGAVVEDIRLVNADLVVDAPNVTVRRVEVQGGSIDNFRGSTCRNGMVLEEVSVIRSPGQVTSGDDPAIGTGGYTARRVLIDGLPEGFRVGGKGSGCGPVTIQSSFARVVSPDRCGDWHGDALQGYDGPALTLQYSTLVLVEADGCGGTAPFFYPAGQGNTSVDITGLTVSGGGYSFRLGMPGRVSGLSVVDQSWGYGPLQVSCSALSSWDARLVRGDGNAQVLAALSPLACQN